MKNFVRALRFAWPYRGRLFFSILCALLAAALWSLTFTAIYPVQKILGSDKNLQEYINDSIQDTNKQVDELQKEIDLFTGQKRTIENSPCDKKHATPNSAARTATWPARRASSTPPAGFCTVNRSPSTSSTCFSPTTASRPWPGSSAWSSSASPSRASSSSGQESLVGSVVNLSLFDLRNRFYRNVIHLDVGPVRRDRHPRADGPLHQRHGDWSGHGKTLFGKVVAEPLKAAGLRRRAPASSAGS